MSSIVTNKDGRPEVFVIGSDDRALWHQWVDSTGSWTQWASLGTPAAGVTCAQIAPTRNQDGRIEVLALGSDRQLYHIFQTTPGGGWSPWASLGGSSKQIVVASNSDGRIEVFAVGQDDQVYHLWQTQPNGAWSPWAGLGGQAVSTIDAAVNKDGRIEVFAIGLHDAGHVYHNWQNDWAGWADLGGFLKKLCASTNHDGRIEVFGIGQDDSIYHIWQTTSGGAWTPSFAPLGNGGSFSQLHSFKQPNGCLQVIALGTNGDTYRILQTAPGGGWTDWQRVMIGTDTTIFSSRALPFIPPELIGQSQNLISSRFVVMHESVTSPGAGNPKSSEQLWRECGHEFVNTTIDCLSAGAAADVGQIVLAAALITRCATLIVSSAQKCTQAIEQSGSESNSGGSGGPNGKPPMAPRGPTQWVGPDQGGYGNVC